MMFVAPADRPLTRLHIKDPDSVAVSEIGEDEAHNGATFCGLPLRASELWQLLDRQAGDKICPACQAAATTRGVLTR